MSTTELTVNAQAVLDLLHFTEIPFAPNRPGAFRFWELALESGNTRREMLDDLPEPRRTAKYAEAEVWGFNLDSLDTIYWTIQGPQHSTFFDVMTLHEWLEWEAAKMPDGYRVRGLWGKDNREVGEVTSAQAAEIWGVGQGTWRAYVARGQAPSPSRTVGRVNYWSEAEVREALEQRRGQGWRANP